MSTDMNKTVREFLFHTVVKAAQEIGSSGTRQRMPIEVLKALFPGLSDIEGTQFTVQDMPRNIDGDKLIVVLLDKRRKPLGTDLIPKYVNEYESLYQACIKTST